MKWSLGVNTQQMITLKSSLQPETILSHIKFFLSRLTSLNEESLVHISRVLDPSRPSFRSLANQTRPLRKRYDLESEHLVRLGALFVGSSDLGFWTFL